jgi:hypothetical protein
MVGKGLFFSHYCISCLVIFVRNVYIYARIYWFCVHVQNTWNICCVSLYNRVLSICWHTWRTVRTIYLLWICIYTRFPKIWWEQIVRSNTCIIRNSQPISVSHVSCFVCFFLLKIGVGFCVLCCIVVRYYLWYFYSTRY